MNDEDESTPESPKKRKKLPPALTENVYNKILEAYRLHPYDHQTVSDLTGQTLFRCKRLFEQGSKQYGFARPIYDVLEDDQEELRVQRQKLKNEEMAERRKHRADAKKDAIEAAAQEARASAASRTNAIALSRVLSQMLQALIPLSKRTADALQSAQLDHHQALSVIKDIALITKRSNEAIQSALTIERMRVGDPIAVLGIRAEDISTEDALAELNGINRTLERAKRLGFKVIDGGIR
jgi:hypothetical protein